MSAWSSKGARGARWWRSGSPAPGAQGEREPSSMESNGVEGAEGSLDRAWHGGGRTGRGAGARPPAASYGGSALDSITAPIRQARAAARFPPPPLC